MAKAIAMRRTRRSHDNKTPQYKMAPARRGHLFWPPLGLRHSTHVGNVAAKLAISLEQADNRHRVWDAVRTFITSDAEGVFDPEAINILVGAFDDAWQSLVASGSPLAEERYRDKARLILAKHIIELARLGERDKKRLTERALMELARSN